MKKIFRIMAVLATVSAVTAVSCAKPEMDDSVSAEEVYDGPVKSLVFNAFVGEAQTKTTLGTPVVDGEGKTTIPVLWESGDKVDLYWMEGETSQKRTGEIAVDEETKAAVLTVKVSEALPEETVFYAVYPSGTGTTLAPENGEIEISIPTVTGTFKKANIMVARCSDFSNAPALAFKHACSIIRFVTGDHAFFGGKSIDRISLYDGEHSYVTGKVSFDFTDDSSIAINTTTADGERYATASNVAPNAECFLAVLPDYNFDMGFVANYYDQQLSAYTENPFSVARGEILSVGNIQDKLDDHRDYYFKPTASGTGDASSWENAGDIAKFREILTEKTPNARGYIQRLKLDNTNYHFLQGTYQPAPGGDGKKYFSIECTQTGRGSAMPINIYGGYSSADPSVRNPEQYATVFTGNNQYSILSVRDRVILTLDGITFQDGRWNYAEGQPGYVYGTALFLGRANADFAAPEVHVNNCKFIDNRQEINKSDVYHGGAAINVREGKVYVDGSLFQNNYGYNRGGAIRINNNASAGTIAFFNSCSFTGNACGSGFANVIWSSTTKCKVGFNNCTLKENRTTNKAVSAMTLTSPFVMTNNTVIESTYNTSDIVIRMVMSNTEDVYANNILVDQGLSGEIMKTYSASGTCTLKSGGYNYLSKACTTISGVTYTSSDKDVAGITTGDFGDWQWNAAGYFTWNGSYASAENTMEYMPATDLVAATRANSQIGDDFYNWLVKIGAIVNGQFTDCRGYLRPTDGMCPGAYDPNAVSSTSQPE